VVSHDEIGRLLAASDVVAVPSVRFDAGNVDGLPNVLLEAMACGSAVVATTAGGIPDTVRDGETGLLVPERDPEALARTIDTLLAASDRRRALGAAARLEAERRFSWARVAERFEAAYDAAARRT
jgi:glycosyltransferase involved in cell wall biosynthesis